MKMTRLFAGSAALGLAAIISAGPVEAQADFSKFVQIGIRSPLDSWITASSSTASSTATASSSPGRPRSPASSSPRWTSQVSAAAAS